MLATAFLTLLRARVDWLSAKVVAAESAWVEYQDAQAATERAHGARPFTSRQSWLRSAWTYVSPAARLSDVYWLETDTQYGRGKSKTFGDMRDAARAYVSIVQQQTSVTDASLLQQTDLYNLRSRGDPLLTRAQAISARWAGSYASAYDPKVTTDSDMWLRTLARITPYSRYESSIPGITTTLTQPGGEPQTGPNMEVPPQGLPPWVAPVVGGILVVGVGYALYRYSQTH